MRKLSEVCRYVRSKNAGPFWITVDLFFENKEYFQIYSDDPGISVKAIAALYDVDAALVRRYRIDALNVVKISFPRNTPQGGAIERDMHSGQQFVPLLTVEMRGGQVSEI
jgi:hypothetical protein